MLQSFCALARLCRIHIKRFRRRRAKKMLICKWHRVILNAFFSPARRMMIQFVTMTYLERPVSNTRSMQREREV